MPCQIFSLSRYQKRTFVPEDADLRNKEEVVFLYEQLHDREIPSSEKVEQWLLDRSELDAALDQEAGTLYIQMTCQTDHAEYAEDYKKFIETITPAVEPLENKLDQKYLALRERFPFQGSRYEVYDRAIRAGVELFREENVPLKTQVHLLSQEYQSICGGMTVHFKEKEYTLAQMEKFLRETDRTVRESAWAVMAERRLQERDRLDEVFDKMLTARNTIATNAGCDGFCDYQFRAYQRFDYTPQDCKRYHRVIEEVVVPVEKKILERRREQMKLESLRPWDIRVDPLGRPALKPFEKTHGLVGGVTEIFGKVHSQWGTQFHQMAEKGLLDLDSRKGKAPGGYQNTLAEARQPFIFMNAVGLDDDVKTLLHEGGHAFHALACAGEPIHDYRHAPMEFCEVASMSMELLGEEYLSVFYDKEDAQRSRRSHLEGIIQILVWVANIDAFQHWIYENPGHTRQQRAQAWITTWKRFGGNLVNWHGLEKFQESMWHRQLHIFEVPFYYMEYGIAQLGALQIWLNARKDRSGSIARYRKALSLGGSRPLPELFEAAGLKFDFSENTIAPLVRAVEKELELS